MANLVLIVVNGGQELMMADPSGNGAALRAAATAAIFHQAAFWLTGLQQVMDNPNIFLGPLVEDILVLSSNLPIPTHDGC